MLEQLDYLLFSMTAYLETLLYDQSTGLGRVIIVGLGEELCESGTCVFWRFLDKPIKQEAS